MPPVSGFSDNPFRSRSDLLRAAGALLAPLNLYRSPAGARLKLQPSTHAAFDDVAAQLEGFARPLWAIAGLLGQGGHSGSLDVSHWLGGLEAGVNPESKEYWGDLGDFDQRMVEMESIAFAILTAPEEFMSLYGETTKRQLVIWLSQINDHSMPANNWRWFRVFVNLALYQVLGVPEQDVRDKMDADFTVLDSFYLGEGWSSDGLWGEERKQADYYSGSFAIQFAQLLYVHLATNDQERVQKYCQQAREFGAKYWRYFDPSGAAIPFGRSMTYRFAFAAFWAATAISGVQLDAPLNDPGTVKGLLLRHLRWWSRHHDMFNTNGTLNIGFTYPNMYLSEDYNSPQSVYWCLKSFIALQLPEDHAFWTCDERPHPLEAASASNATEALAKVEVIWPPRHIICSAPEHHYFLSSGQMTKKAHKAREAKYGKMAYSSAFGFSVPSGPALHQIAPDSTLCASVDGGETWVVRSEPFDVRMGHAIVDVGSSQEVSTVPALVSCWRPWKLFSVEVETTLIPLAQKFPGWHIRVHRVKRFGEPHEQALASRIELVDAGFAIPALASAGYHVPAVQSPDGIIDEGHYCDSKCCLIQREEGASGFLDLTADFQARGSATHEKEAIGIESQGHLVRADPNTNLMSQRTFIPTVKHTLSYTSLPPISQTVQSEACIASAAFAVSASTQALRHDIPSMWSARPFISLAEPISNSTERIYRISTRA